jgi:hypothetical protein
MFYLHFECESFVFFLSLLFAKLPVEWYPSSEVQLLHRLARNIRTIPPRSCLAHQRKAINVQYEIPPIDFCTTGSFDARVRFRTHVGETILYPFGLDFLFPGKGMLANLQGSDREMEGLTIHVGPLLNAVGA